MLNKYISAISGFMLGYGVTTFILSGDWNFIIFAASAVLIAYFNFTGKGEYKISIDDIIKSGTIR